MARSVDDLGAKFEPAVVALTPFSYLEYGIVLDRLRERAEANSKLTKLIWIAVEVLGSDKAIQSSNGLDLEHPIVIGPRSLKPN